MGFSPSSVDVMMLLNPTVRPPAQYLAAQALDASMLHNEDKIEGPGPESPIDNRYTVQIKNEYCKASRAGAEVKLRWDLRCDLMSFAELKKELDPHWSGLAFSAPLAVQLRGSHKRGQDNEDKYFNWKSDTEAHCFGRVP